MSRQATRIVEGLFKELRRSLPPQVSDIEALSAANKLCNIANPSSSLSSAHLPTYESRFSEPAAPKGRRIRLWIFSDDYLTEKDIWSMSEELRDVLIHNGCAQLNKEYLR